MARQPHPATMPRRSRTAGATLIEMVITIVVITVGIAGILLTIQRTITFSADPLIRHQAIAIAEAYMDEILLQSYDDPDGSEGSETRATFDDVVDYDGLSEQPTTPAGTVTGLEAYRVTVAVAKPSALSAGSDTVTDMALVTIIVSHDVQGQQFVLTAYRAKY